MATCCAGGCKNYRRKHRDLSFFSLPKHELLAKEWLKVIRKGRAKTELPKHVFLCEKHFTIDSFDVSVDLQNKFLMRKGQKRKARRLLPAAVPKLFMTTDDDDECYEPVIYNDVADNSNQSMLFGDLKDNSITHAFLERIQVNRPTFATEICVDEPPEEKFFEKFTDLQDWEPPTMSIETAKSPAISHSIQSMKSTRAISSSDDANNDSSNNGGRIGSVVTNGTSKASKESLHSYHMWLKEKHMREEEEKNSLKINGGGGNVKEEDDDDTTDENFQVDAVLERGPSPPEQETSSSYEWSYEEQFKQLYEIDEDPDRKTFLDEYFEFMKSRGTPVSRIPIMAKQILDLYQLYNLVVKHGGLVQVIRNKLWSKITKGLNLPTSITSAAFTLRTQYLKYLYPYECTMHNFSTPKELQAAIDSNRRDRFSTLYHAEPSMTPSRDDRYGGFPLNGCDYPVAPPRHHMTHPALTSSQVDMRYGLKRPGDPMAYPKSYDKYGVDNPKVIVLPDGATPPMADRSCGKVSPPPASFHSRTRSPLRDSDIRSMGDIEASRIRGHPFGSYGGSKEWDGEVRHAMEEESRRRLLDDARMRNGALICKDKNCNGIDCKYSRPDFHRHRSHDPMVAVCSCSYCKDYRSYSPTRRDLPPRHHMDGASASSHVAVRERRGSQSPPHRNGGLNSSLSSPPPSLANHHNKENEENNAVDSTSKMTTLKMKLPDIRQGGNSIQISLEVAGVLYEGVISAAATPATNGESAEDNDTSLNGRS